MFLSSLNYFNFSVYLYGEAAVEDYRKTVPQIRSGEYEGLDEKVICFIYQRLELEYTKCYYS